MEIIAGDLLTIEGEKYITLEVLEYENNHYALVNELTKEEENTDEYHIFKIFNGEIRFVLDYDLINILIPMFEEKINKDIKKILEN